MTQMNDLDKRLEIRHKPAREVAVTMRAVMFEVMIAMWIVAVLAALAAIFW
jgi:hypothetical protein